MALNPISLLQGASRERIDPAQVATLRSAGVLVDDPRRSRPRYFDGRFLAARDLIRDQQYFLTREADLGRAAGSGVANGLGVARGSTPTSLRIGRGEGLTPAGELVLLAEDMTLDLADVPQAEQLSARFGLGRVPVPPLRSRTGLYVLALRPVEFTANPVGAYPTSLTGPRRVEDGDVIEATAIVLVPWQDDGAADALDQRRGRAARTIFTGEGKPIASANVLPIAMLALEANALIWIDEAMVRRELGADRGDLPGLGFAPRGLRLAHLVQHQGHLADVSARLGGRVFPAASEFPVLPPAGPLPRGVIDPADFTQRYFPSEVDVDFSIVPDDELPMLVEEALALPPIDFSAGEATLDRTAVLVLAPVPRADFRAVQARLLTRSRVLRPAPPNLIAQRKPLEVLQRLRLPLPLAVPATPTPADAEWARLAALPTLWFLRRRNLAYRDDLVGNGVAATGDEELEVEAAVTARMATLGLTASFNAAMTAATRKAAWSVVSLLALPALVASPTLSAAAIGALRARIAAHPTRRLTNADALAVGNELRSGVTGSGLLTLESGTSGPVAPRTLERLASNDAWRRVDAQALVGNAAELERLRTRLFAVPASPVAPVESAQPSAPVAPAPPAAPSDRPTGGVRPGVTTGVTTGVTPVVRPVLRPGEPVLPVRSSAPKAAGAAAGATAAPGLDSPARSSRRAAAERQAAKVAKKAAEPAAKKARSKPAAKSAAKTGAKTAAKTASKAATKTAAKGANPAPAPSPPRKPRKTRGEAG